MFPARTFGRFLAAALCLAGIVRLSADDLRAVPFTQAPPTEQEAVQFRWRMASGQSFYQQMTTETTQTIKLMGRSIEQKGVHVFWSRWGSIEKQGMGWALTQNALAVKADMGELTRCDSRQNNPNPSPLEQCLSRLPALVLKVTAGPDLTVQNLQGLQPFIQRVTANHSPEVQARLQALLPEAWFKEATEATFAFGPTDGAAVKKGGSWTRKSGLDLGLMGRFEVTSRYTYEGKEGKYDRIRATTTTKYLGPGARPGGQPPFQINKPRWKSGEGSRVILYDPAKGRMVTSTGEVRLEGTMILNLNDNELEIELSWRLTTRIQNTDTNPLK